MPIRSSSLATRRPVSLVQHDQTRGQRPRHAGVRAIHAVGCAHVKKIAVDENRAVGRVLAPNVQIVDDIDLPKNVGVRGLQSDRRAARAGDEAAFVGKRPVVAVGQAVDVEANDLAAIGHQVDAIAVDGGRGADAQAHIVEIEIPAGSSGTCGTINCQSSLPVASSRHITRPPRVERTRGSCKSSSLVPI